ncbi:MAG: hypothetical protein ACREJC_22080, partial [Tepidisphaeraceae bacterium]
MRLAVFEQNHDAESDYPERVQSRLRTATATSAARRKVYAVLNVACLAVAMLLTVIRGAIGGHGFNFAHGDSRWYYVQLVSPVVDGDLDFSNQMRMHWGTEFEPHRLENKTPRGYVNPRYTLGFASSLAPSFLAAHAVATAVHALTPVWFFEPNGYTPLYQILNAAMVFLYVWGMMVLLDWIAQRYLRADPLAIASGIILIVLGSQFSYHYVRVPFAIHVVSLFWVTAVVALSMWMGELAERRVLRLLDVFALAFVASMAIECRPTNVVILPFLIYVAVKLLRNGMWRRMAALVPIAVAGCLPILLQMWFWHRLFGSWITFAYDPGERFYWSEPRLWQTLFSSRKGLYFWSPILVLATIGCVARMLKGGWRSPLLICSSLSFLLLWYLNSAWYEWWFGGSFGARAFLEGMVILFFGMIFFVEIILRSRRPAFGVLAGLTILT